MSKFSKKAMCILGVSSILLASIVYCSASEEEAQVGQDSSPPPPPPPPPPPAAEGALWTPFYMPTGMAELMYRQVYERAPFNRARKAFFTYCGAGSDRDPSPTGFFNAIVLACNEFPRCVNEHMHPLMVELAALQANLSNTDNELRAVRDADTDSFLYDYLGWVRHTEDMNARETFLCEQLMSIHKDIHECEEKIKAHQALLALPTDHLISKLTHDLRNSDGHLLASWSEVESHARAAASKARLGSVATVKQVEYESQFKFVHSALPGFLISLLSAHADEGGWIVLNSDGNDSVSRMMTALNELFNIWRKKELLELLIKYHPIRSTKSSVYRSQKISAIPLWIELNELISVTLAGPARLNIVPVLSVHEGACVVEVPEAITLIRNAFMANAARLEEEFGGRFRAWDVAYVLFYGNEDERMELLRREDVRNYLNVLLNKKLNIIDCFYGTTVRMLNFLYPGWSDRDPQECFDHPILADARVEVISERPLSRVTPRRAEARAEAPLKQLTYEGAPSRAEASAEASEEAPASLAPPPRFEEEAPASLAPPARFEEEAPASLAASSVSIDAKASTEQTREEKTSGENPRSGKKHHPGGKTLGKKHHSGGKTLGEKHHFGGKTLGKKHHSGGKTLGKKHHSGGTTPGENPHSGKKHHFGGKTLGENPRSGGKTHSGGNPRSWKKHHSRGKTSGENLEERLQEKTPV